MISLYIEPYSALPSDVFISRCRWRKVDSLMKSLHCIEPQLAVIDRNTPRYTYMTALGKVCCVALSLCCVVLPCLVFLSISWTISHVCNLHVFSSYCVNVLSLHQLGSWFYCCVVCDVYVCTGSGWYTSWLGITLPTGVSTTRVPSVIQYYVEPHIHCRYCS